MQDNKNLQPFDNDILQSKADILKALGGSKEQAAPTPPVPPMSPAPQNGADDTRIADDFLEAQLRESPTPAPPARDEQPLSGHDSEDIRILPYEALPKRPAPIDNAPSQTGAAANSEAEKDPEVEFIIADDEELLELSQVDSEEIHAENGILKKTLEQLRKHQEQERSAKEKAIDQLRAMSEAIEPLRQTNEQLRRRIDELMVQNEQCTRETNQIHQGLIHSLEQEKAAHASAVKAMQSLQSDLQKTQKARDFLSESFSSVSQQNESLQSQIDQLTREKANLQAKAEHVEAAGLEQKKELENRLKNIEAASEQSTLDLRRQNAELAAERNRLQEALEILETRASQLHESELRRESRIRELEEEAARRQHEMPRLEEENRQLRAFEMENASLRTQLTETEAALSQRQAAIRQLEAQLRELKEKIASAELETRQVEESGRKLEQEEQIIRRELEAIRSTYSKYRQDAEEEAVELNHRIQTLLGQLKKLEDQIAHHPEEVRQIEQDLECQRQSAAQLKADLDAVCGREKTLQEQLAAMEATSKARDLQNQSQWKAAQAEKIALEEQQQQLKDDLADLQRKLEQLAATQAADASAASEPADKRLEILLEPEEVSALMKSPEADEEDFSDEPAEAAVDEAASDVAAVTDKGAFNLADLIMSEHRRSVSSRRQRIQPIASGQNSRGTRHVVQQYIKPGPDEFHPAAASTAARMWEDNLLTPFQRELLREVIQRDIEHLKEKPIARSQSRP
ncbi:MAG: hypothetical protein LLF76_08595 [Planctomycetaceae bacterium]|nr:hypothetical protein [Planctomycetaceae bacterium]